MPTGLDFERGLKRPRHRHSTMVFTFDASSTADAPHDQAHDTRSLLLSSMIVCLVVCGRRTRRSCLEEQSPLRRFGRAPMLGGRPCSAGGLALSSSVVGVRVGQCGGRWEGGRVRSGCRAGRPASSGRDLSEVGFGRSRARVLGGHTPLQVPLTGTFDPRHAVGRQHAATNYC